MSTACLNKNLRHLGEAYRGSAAFFNWIINFKMNQFSRQRTRLSSSRRLAPPFLLRHVPPHYCGDEILSLFDGWYLITAIDDPLKAGIIRGQGQGQVTPEQVDELPQVAAAAEDIVPGIERLPYPQKFGRAGHELHQPHGPFGGNGPGAEIRFS